MTLKEFIISDIKAQKNVTYILLMDLFGGSQLYF